MEEKLRNIESRIQLENKLICVRDRFRRNNLNINGINEKPNKTWEACEKELDTLLKNSLSIEEEVVIER